MSNLRREILRTAVVLLLCGSVGLWAAQKKPSATKSAAATAVPAKAIAVHDFEVEGVALALTEATRTAPDVVTIKWEYRNKTSKLQRLTTASYGWSDPYQLAWDSYVLGSDGKTKIPLMKDSGGTPIAARLCLPNKTITVGPKKTVKSWAKYAVPTGTAQITIVMTGAEPFENVAVAETASGGK